MRARSADIFDPEARGLWAHASAALLYRYLTSRPLFYAVAHPMYRVGVQVSGDRGVTRADNPISFRRQTRTKAKDDMTRDKTPTRE